MPSQAIVRISPSLTARSNLIVDERLGLEVDQRRQPVVGDGQQLDPPMGRVYAVAALENLDDEAGAEPSLEARLAVMRPQLVRIAADILCLQ